ncbi:MAG: hypothetical protein AAF414_11965 [Pseudomonadota bacterium]
MPAPTKKTATCLLTTASAWCAFLVASSANSATIEGQWLDMMGSVEVGGMSFGDAEDIAETIEGAGHPCDRLIRLETMPSSLLATCEPDSALYRLLPDTDGEPLVAPLR